MHTSVVTLPIWGQNQLGFTLDASHFCRGSSPSFILHTTTPPSGARLSRPASTLPLPGPTSPPFKKIRLPYHYLNPFPNSRQSSHRTRCHLAQKRALREIFLQ